MIYDNNVEAIHQNNLAADTEQRLILLLTQIIEQKFKTLSYKELEAMLRLTPFKETLSYREALQEDLQSYSIDMLTEQIARKFKFAQSTVIRLQQRLRQLSLDDLKALFGDIIEMERLAEINAWLDDRLEQVKHE